MNEGMKRLLKCDSGCLLKNLGTMAEVGILLVVWFWIIYGKVLNVMFAVTSFMGLLMISDGVRDWQNQIRVYIGMGITRKTTFAVLVIRGLLEVFLGLLLNVLISAAFYREYLKGEVLIGGLLLLLFCNGWGQLSGTVGVCWKYGKVVQVIGLMIVGAVFGGGCMFAVYENVLDEMVKWLNPAILTGMGVVCCMMWAAGIITAYRQLKKYTVA